MPKIRTLLTVLATLVLLGAGCGTDPASDSTASDTAANTAGDDAGTAQDSAPASADTAEDASGDQDASGDEDVPAASAADDGAADGTGATASGDFPATIESAAGTWTLDSAPQRIVSLSPMATEILFAIGAGPQVIAVDSYSYYPDEAPVTDLSGWDPNVEAILAYEPDLVVIVNDANELIASLTEVDVPVLVSAAPTNFEDGYASIADLGVATGQIDQAAEVVATLRSEIAAALASAPDVPVRVYHEIDDTFYSASSFGFIGAIYSEMGAINIADEADPDQWGYPQLTEEYIVEADPELIIITDQVGYSPDEVGARPGWEQVTAVRANNIVVVDADIASRWGPRLPEFMTAVAKALSTAAVPA